MTDHPSERPGGQILPWTAPAYRRPPRHVVISDEAAIDLADLHLRAVPDERGVAWHWPSFGWGLRAGTYVGCMLTVLLAYAWSFYL